MTNYEPFGNLLENVVDNRGKTCPTADDGLPLIATNCISNDYLYPQFLKVRYVDDDTYNNWFRGHPEPGDMVFVLKGTPGRVAWVPNPVNFCIAQDMVAIRADQEKIYPKYLFAALRSKIIQHQIENLHVGTLIPHFKKGDFDDLLIPIPDQKTQRFIGEQYFNISLKIDLLHRQNETLEALAQTLFRQWFVEEAEDGWEEKPLKKVCEIKNGYAFKSSTYQDSGYRIIRTVNFENHLLILEGLTFISHDLAIDFKKYNLKRFDFLLVMVGASLGNFAIVTQDVLPALQNQNMWCFRAKKGVSQHYLNFAIQDIVSKNLHSASGSARQFFQKRVFYEFSLVVPPKQLIQKFTDIAENLYSKIELNQAQIRTLENIRDALLPKLMSGEVRVA